jgi:hypothetical protein
MNAHDEQQAKILEKLARMPVNRNAEYADAFTSAIAALRRASPETGWQELLEACHYRDNGYDKCRLCRGWAHMGEWLRHDEGCPVAKVMALSPTPVEVPHA